jgi:hypothetical protein
MKFRQRQMQFLISRIDGTKGSASDILKTITILDTIYWLHAAWRGVKASTIQGCFAKAGFPVQKEQSESTADSDNDEDDDLPLSELANKIARDMFDCDYRGLSTIDESLAPMDFNDTPANDSPVEPSDTADPETDKEDEPNHDCATVTFHQAIDCMSTFKSYFITR